MNPSARSHPSVSAVKKAIDSGQLGATALVRLHHWRPRSAEPLDALLMADLDVVLWLFGQWPAYVFARGSHVEATAAPLDGDHLQVHLDFADRGMALVDVAQMLPEGAGYFSLSVIGGHGSAYADDHPNTHLLFRGGPASAILAEPLRFAAEQMTLPQASFERLAPLWRAVRKSMGSDQAAELPGGRYDF